jgi:hypothetical protein
MQEHNKNDQPVTESTNTIPATYEPRKTPPFSEKFPLPVFVTQEEEDRILAAYEKDAAEVSHHSLSLGRWVLGAVFDWCEVVEKHQSERD